MNTVKARVAAVADLRDYDHCFMSPEGVAHFNAIFGVEIEPYVAQADPKALKGLRLSGGAKSAAGYDAADYAETVCRLVGSPFRPWQSGRGSRLASACDALVKHFGA